MAAPVIESFAETKITSGFPPNVTVAKPAGVTSGDLLVCIIATGGGGNHPTTSSGWDAVEEVYLSTSIQANIGVYKKIAGGTEPADYTFTFASVTTSGCVAVIFRVSGADATTPINVSGNAENTATSTSIVAPSVTTTADGCLLLCVASPRGGGQTFTGPGGMTLEWQASNSTTQFQHWAIAVASEALGAAGSTGTRTFTSSASQASVAVSIAIAPASGGGGGTTYDRDAAVTSASDFAASAVRTLQRAADISGVSSFTAAGTVSRARAALMAGVSTFAAVARLERSRSVVVAGASAFTAQGAVTRSRSAAFAGTSAFTAAAEVAGQIPRSASFASQSSFSAERVVTYSRSAAFAAGSGFTATQDAPSGLQRGGFMPRRPRRVIPIEELFAVRDIFRGEEEPDRPAPPTRKRIKAVEHRVVNAVIDPYQPSVVRTEVRAFVHREVKAAVHPGLSWQDLSVIFERIMHEAAEKAAEVEREIEEEDEMILLLAA